MTDKPSKTARSPLKPAGSDVDALPAKVAEGLEKQRQWGKQLRQNARASFRAMEGALSVRSEEDWIRLSEQSREQYESGQFLLDRLGSERFLDPKLITTLMALRQRAMVEWGITTAAETMLLDLALLHYYHVLRVQGWIGDLALHIEREFFGSGAFAADYRDLSPRSRRAAEDGARRLSEQLLPLLERANRMFIRNLAAIKDLRQRPVPAIAIGRAEQVTVGPTGRRGLRPAKGARNARPEGRPTRQALTIPYS